MQHTFVILTKQPEIYKKYTFPHNTILGVSITKNSDINKLKLHLLTIINNRVLISFEPIQEKINNKIMDLLYFDGIDWIHVGEESGNRKERIRATREMIHPFFGLDIPVFMKNNLNRLFPGQLRKEFPNE